MTFIIFAFSIVRIKINKAKGVTMIAVIFGKLPTSNHIKMFDDVIKKIDAAAAPTLLNPNLRTKIYAVAAPNAKIRVIVIEVASSTERLNNHPIKPNKK